MTDGIDRQGWRHCYECGARADVLRYDTYYKLVECRDCGEESYIPKKCATAFNDFREFVERALSPEGDRTDD
jgi:hypothetical protein